MHRFSLPLAGKNFRGERSALDAEMRGFFSQDACKGAYAEVCMVGNCHVVLAALMRRETHVAAAFACHHVPIRPQCAREFAPR